MSPKRGTRGRKDEDESFEKRFEDEETLQGLLELAGSELSPGEVERRFKEAQQLGDSPPEVFPTLFNGEPRFSDPRLARRLYSNLFGLWERVVQGRGIPKSRPDRPKKVRPEPPPLLEEGQEPDAAWVQKALHYVRHVEGVGRMRLEHAFENREDALLVRLDEEGYSDEVYLTVRRTLFELFSMVELGTSAGAGQASAEYLTLGKQPLPSPSALREVAKASLADTASAGALGLVERALGAFWRGRTAKR